jgi:class 3 adenylate cyclase/tetratricopeptide (TPR) repeat protein
LFCDLVGSTEIASRLDPEDWHRISKEYQQAAAAAVTRFGGHVNKFLGDGLVCFFGVPQAHEDDAERAVRAGLGIVEAVQRLDGVTPAVRLQVRVGLHTGTVVVAHDADAAQDVFGDTPNIAALVHSVAEADSVFITAATHRLISGLFIVAEQGARSLKGVPEPVDLYRVAGASGVRGRLAAAAAAARALTSFVGREHERRLLRDRFEQARNGEGQVVVVVGEAGIGKSRLAQVLHQDLAEVPHTWLETGGQPYFADTPFYAITELLKHFFAWHAEDSGAARVEALAGALHAAGLDPNVAVPLIVPLLDLPVPERYPAVLATPQVARERLVATLAAWALANARLQPLVMLFEDLHWVDASTLEILQLLVDQSASAPLVLLLTARPEFCVPWPLGPRHTEITLNRLSSQQTRMLLQAVASRARLPEELMQAVIARTDGVPLFAEELANAAVEAGAKAVAAIPATLADSLMARLDRLGTQAKDVAQIGAVLGREFSHPLIAALVAAVCEPALGEAGLEAALAKLIHAELVYARGEAPQATYSFKHALVQDAAYGSLLKARRRMLHGHVARLLLADFPSVAEAHPELLAQHYTHAGDAEPAIEAWQRAAERAFRTGAASAAEAHARRGLALLDTLPENPARDQRELGLQVLLGQAVSITKGYASAEVEAPLSRVRTLGPRIDDPIKWTLNVVMLWGMMITRDGPLAARPFADEALVAAERAGPAVKAWAYFPQVSTNFYCGNYSAACDYAARAVALYAEAEPLSSLIFDVRVTCETYAAVAELFLGHADRARHTMREVVAHAQRTGRPIDRSWAGSFAAFMFASLDDYAAMAPHVAGTLEACAVEPNTVYQATADITASWAMAKQGEIDAGITCIRSALNKLTSTGQRLGLEQNLGHLADALARAGRFDEALSVLADAEGACPGDEYYRAETLRLRAEVLSHTAATDADVEPTFHAALDWSRRQGAKMFELRTSVSYARWLRNHHRAADGRNLLAPICAWFTEGLDTRDLQDARALLDELGE